MKELILKNWNFIRVVKLSMGAYLVYEAITSKQYILLLLAALFLYQSIFNVSTCGINGCSVNPKVKEE
jgi:uncharacterized membrane protein HdeD (DUF308 family)